MNNERWLDSYYIKLYDAYSEDLARHLRQKGISNTEEMVNEVFVRLYIAFRKLSREEILARKFPGYLYAIARNYQADQYRYFSRLSRLIAEDMDNLLEDTLFPQPEIEYLENELRERLEKAIARLPGKFAPVVQKWLEGKSLVQIARELAIEPATAGYRFKKGLILLRAMPEIQELRDE